MIVVTRNWKLSLVGLAVSVGIFLVIYFTAIQPSTNTANAAIKAGVQQSSRCSSRPRSSSTRPGAGQGRRRQRGGRHQADQRRHQAGQQDAQLRQQAHGLRRCGGYRRDQAGQLPGEVQLGPTPAAGAAVGAQRYGGHGARAMTASRGPSCCPPPVAPRDRGPTDIVQPAPRPITKGCQMDGDVELVPGDELVPEADMVLDRRAVLDAAPEQVWPWLVQLGKQRAGWYLPSPLERLVPARRRAARQIDPRFQTLAVGDRSARSRTWPGRHWERSTGRTASCA